MQAPIAAYRLRAAIAADSEWIYTVTEIAMRGYVEQTWGRWDAREQQASHQRAFRPEAHQIVCVGAAAAGVLSLEEHATHLQLDRLYLLPQHRNRGLGALLLDAVKRQAARAGKPVRLRVLRANTHARRFYERHGFVVTQQTVERWFMQCAAPAASGSCE